MEEILTHQEVANELGEARTGATDKLRNGTFSALILGTLAFLLMGAAAVRSSFAGFWFYSFPAALIVAVAARRYRGFGTPEAARPLARSLSYRGIASVLLLFASGAALGWVMSTESFFVLGLAVCCFAWLPWNRLSFHRQYLKASAWLVAAGIALGWFSFASAPAPITVGVMGWFVSIGGCAALLKGK